MKFRKALITTLIVLCATSLVAQMEQGWNSFEYRGRHCSLATLQGTYGSWAEGQFLVRVGTSPAPPYPSVAVALHTFDGSGHWSLTFARSLGGMIIPWGATASGTYSVTPDCELSVAGSTPQGLPTAFAGPITGEGIFQEVHITYTDPSQVNSATLRKTPPGGCSQQTLKGEYAVFGHGFATLPGLPPLVPIAHVGSFVADGNGKFSGGEIFKVGNITGVDTFTATYNVNRDCTMSAEITAGSDVVHEFGIITGTPEFQEVHLINTDSGCGYGQEEVVRRTDFVTRT